MSLKITLKHLVAGIVISIASVPAFAQWAVFDPTNWIANNSQALSGVKTELNTAKTLIQQTQTAINMAKSVKSIANMDSLAQVQESLRLYKQLQAVDGLLERDFQQSAELTERVSARYGASDMPWGEYLASRDKLELQQRETSAQRYRAINSSIEQTSRQRQALVGQLSTVNGQTEAMQTLGASIDVLIGQNQQIISLLAATQRTAEMKQQDQATDANKSADEAAKLLNERQQRLRNAAAKY